MSEAQIDGGDRGQAAEDKVGGWLGDMDDAAALYWYGSFSLIMAGASLAVVILMNQDVNIIGSGRVDIYKSFWRYYLPVGITWFFTGFVRQNDFLESILRRLIVLSVIGVFYDQWQHFTSLWNSWNSNDGLTFYLWFAGYFVGIIIQEIIQILLVPQVLNHLGGEYEDEWQDIFRMGFA